MANKNTQRREKKKKRHKHPELGRTQVVSSRSTSYLKSSKKDNKPKACDKCKQKPKNYLFIGGQMIKNICKCNEYLLEEESNRIREKRKQKDEK